MEGQGVSEGRAISMRRAYVELVLCVFFWGASFASMKIATGEVTPPLAVFMRIFFGMPILIGAVLTRREFALPGRREVPALVFLGALGVVFHQNIQFYGMQSAGVANANWMIAGTPSVVALLGWIFLKERLGAVQIAGLLLSGFGVLLVVGLGTRGLGMFALTGTGDLLIAISAVNWAVFQILSRKLVTARPPTYTAFWINAAALAIQTVFVAATRQDVSQLARITSTAWGAMLFLGCICSGLCYILWYDGLSVLPAARVTAFQFLQPVLGVILAYFLMGERFTPFIFAGGALIILGVWMVNRRRA